MYITQGTSVLFIVPKKPCYNNDGKRIAKTNKDSILQTWGHVEKIWADDKDGKVNVRFLIKKYDDSKIVVPRKAILQAAW